MLSHHPGCPVSLLTLLILFAVVWFYISMLVYLIVATRRGRVSRSLMRVYLLCLVQVVIFTFLYHPLWAPFITIEALAFAGNILFPATLFGWYIGDALRLRAR